MAAPDDIKEMQRNDPVAKEQWHAYCEAYGNGVRDPAKHDEAYLQNFVQQYRSGTRLEYKEGAQLVKMVKMGQKKSQSWKAVWEAYCNNSPVDGRATYDPAKHTSAFLEGFVEFMGNMATLGGMGVGGPPGRKPAVSTGDPQKDILVAKIKAFQKRGETEKQTWHEFCDGSLGGLYDPSRHGIDSLQTFVDQKGIQDIPIPASPGGGVGASSPLVMRIKSFQKLGDDQKQAWHAHCDSKLGGVRDPGRHDAAVLEEFISAHDVPP